MEHPIRIFTAAHNQTLICLGNLCANSLKGNTNKTSISRWHDRRLISRSIILQGMPNTSLTQLACMEPLLDSPHCLGATWTSLFSSVADTIELTHHDVEIFYCVASCNLAGRRKSKNRKQRRKMAVVYHVNANRKEISFAIFKAACKCEWWGWCRCRSEQFAPQTNSDGMQGHNIEHGSGFQ